MNIETITIGQLSAGLAFIVGLVLLIRQALKPLTDFEKRVHKIEEHQDNDNKRLDQLESDTKQILLSVNVLLSHSVDNNHTGDLKQRQNELSEYLIRR